MTVKSRRVLAVLAACIAFVLFASGMHRRYVAYLAVDVARESGALEAPVGPYLHMGPFVRAQMRERMSDGSGDFTIPVFGRNGSGTLHAWMQERSERWRVCSLTFTSAALARPIVIVPEETSTCERE